jgi:MFS family permease
MSSTENPWRASTSVRDLAPTGIRHRMVLLATVAAVLLYLDRICMSTMALAVAEDLRIQPSDLDNVLGAFFLTYAIAQLPAGWLGDRYGARWTLGIYTVLWSLCTGLLGFANGLTAVLILRLACGLTQAGAYPVAASMVRRWIPIHRRGLASSAISVGGRLGGALAPVLTIQLMLWWTLGTDWWTAPDDARAAATSWRPVVMSYGIVGVVFAGVFMWRFRDSPHEHPSVNAAELSLIQLGDRMPPSVHRASEPPPIVPLLLSFPMWMNSFVQFAANLGWAFLVTKLPQYLEEVYETTQQSQGWLQSLPLVAGIMGLFLGGAFTDSLAQRFGPRWGRSLAMALSRIIVAAAFLAILMVDSAGGATLCLIVVGLATDLGTPACWAFGQDVGGRHVGSAVGWANMWGNFGAALSPKLFGLIVGAASTAAVGWQTAFATCAAINLIAAIGALGVNATRPLVENT